jgi:hypothetical protein
MASGVWTWRRQSAAPGNEAPLQQVAASASAFRLVAAVLLLAVPAQGSAGELDFAVQSDVAARHSIDLSVGEGRFLRVDRPAEYITVGTMQARVTANAKNRQPQAFPGHGKKASTTD